MGHDAPEITLIGRTSAWRPHHLVAGVKRSIQHEQRASTAPVLVTWLHHHTYGTLGIYAMDKAAVRDLKRQRREWVRVTGIVRPCVAFALTDDPCSGVNHDYTPLLLHVVSAQPVATLPTIWEPPVLSSVQPVRITPGQSAGSGRIAAVVGWADAVYWQTFEAPLSLFAEWNAVRGVVTHFAQHRYLRYVLSRKRASSKAGTQHG